MSNDNGWPGASGDHGGWTQDGPQGPSGGPGQHASPAPWNGSPSEPPQQWGSPNAAPTAAPGQGGYAGHSAPVGVSGHAGGPGGGQGGDRPPRRTWPWLVGALGCIGLLLLGTLVGGGMLWSRHRADSKTAAPTETSASQHPAFTSYGIDEPPEQEPPELIAGLGDNPYLRIDLKAAETGCDLPQISGKIPADKLQSYLHTGLECLAAMWQGPMGQNDFEWEKPDVLVYDPQQVPDASPACADNFRDDRITYCFSENRLYWPTTSTLLDAFPNPTPEQNQQMVMWSLSGGYVRSTYSHSGASAYYMALLDSAESDPAKHAEYERRFGAQLTCLTAATAYALPEPLRPGKDAASAIPALMVDTTDPGAPSRETSLAWMRTGSASPGHLAVCDTWTVPADKVA